MFQNFINILLQLCLASLTLAAPVANDVTTVDNSFTYGTGGGVLGFIVLILDIIVFSMSCHSLPTRAPLPPTNHSRFF